MADDELKRRFRAARRDRELTVLEGFHALKHALRFGAEVEVAVAVDPAELEELAMALAPDLSGSFAGGAVAEAGGPAGGVAQVDAETLAGLVPQAPRTGVVAIARRKRADVEAALADPREAPVVLLEQPRNMGNLGACVRVAAAADAAAVLTIGENDPWHPDAVRGAAGLHYALPAVAAIDRAPSGAEGRPLLALDPEGEEIDPAALPPRAVLAFGTERHGLSDELLAAADDRIALPMRDGVSSLNLATSVAAVLYAVVLQRPRPSVKLH
ncbi:MAG TPA: TrmH family RNA methyltransferase [Solirubrobacterales bacterium]|nr:TrmH family RNA methyltransferase [Solirubrobacterales bacterium]